MRYQFQLSLSEHLVDTPDSDCQKFLFTSTLVVMPAVTDTAISHISK